MGSQVWDEGMKGLGAQDQAFILCHKKLPRL